jgi:hypothetical protein
MLQKRYNGMKYSAKARQHLKKKKHICSLFHIISEELNIVLDVVGNWVRNLIFRAT